MGRKILSGWKEISNHLQRGVRTAQRWEAHLGMPVHRPALKDRSAVVAFSDELDRWIARTAPGAITARGDQNEILARVQDNLGTLQWNTAELATQTRLLQDQLRRSLETHRNRIASRKRMNTVPALGRAKGAMLPFPPRSS